MKNYSYIILSITLLLNYSCSNDFLDVVPKDSLSDATFWKTEEDAHLAFVGAYSEWETWFSILYFDAAADNAYDQHFSWKKLSNSQFLPTDQLNVVQASDYNYTKTRKYNNFLTKIDGADMDEGTRAQYKAEIRFLRAYDYFLKTEKFGDVPLITELVPSDVNLERTPIQEVRNFILNELEEISQILPNKTNSESGGRATAGAALALKARIQLYMGQYEQAMIDSKKVIDMDYELFPDYRGLFLPENTNSNKEAIFTINYANGFLQGIFIPQMCNAPSFGGFSSLSATKGLTDAYETTLGKTIDDPTSGYDLQHPFENRDARLAATFKHSGQIYGGNILNTLDTTLPDGSINPNYHASANGPRGGASLQKYIIPVPISEMQNNAVNVMVIRLAEMYLTYAEAAVELNQNTDTALQLINRLRERGNLPPATELTQDLVRRERRVELAMEGLRYWDVKRWDLGPTVLNGPIYGDPDGTVNMGTGEVTYNGEYILLVDGANRTFHPERNYLLPIPQSEIDITGVEQNPGY